MIASADPNQTGKKVVKVASDEELLKELDALDSLQSIKLSQIFFGLQSMIELIL